MKPEIIADQTEDPEQWELEMAQAALDGLHSAREMKGDGDEMSEAAHENCDRCKSFSTNFSCTGVDT